MDKRTTYIAAALQGMCAAFGDFLLYYSKEKPGSVASGKGRDILAAVVRIAGDTIAAENKVFGETNSAPAEGARPDIIVVDHLPHSKQCAIDLDSDAVANALRFVKELRTTLYRIEALLGAEDTASAKDWVRFLLDITSALDAAVKEQTDA